MTYILKENITLYILFVFYKFDNYNRRGDLNLAN